MYRSELALLTVAISKGRLPADTGFYFTLDA